MDTAKLEYNQLLDKGTEIIIQIDSIKSILGLEKCEYSLNVSDRFNEAQQDLERILQIKSHKELEMKSMLREIADLQRLLKDKEVIEITNLTLEACKRARGKIDRLYEQKRLKELRIENKLREIEIKSKSLIGYLPGSMRDEFKRLDIHEILTNDTITNVNLEIVDDLDKLFNEMQDYESQLRKRLKNAVEELEKLIIDLDEAQEEPFVDDIKMLNQYEQLVLDLREKYKLKMRDTIMKSLDELKQFWDKCQISEQQRREILDIIERDELTVTLHEKITEQIAVLSSRYAKCSKIYQLISDRSTLLKVEFSK